MSGYGNLQKIRNGRRTFAITPHIPGGFILPDDLIRIGEVAKKYKGVLKLTSGQRILITNLKEEDLPAIWEELGMEPAVKVQNSLKNVEICPANYCKRSKYPTIGIGMKLSKRFHGMELPCRTKIGVAGCKNACTSVYSKDIGVMVDLDKTFYITAGGSAGYYPRSADLVTKGLSENEAFNLVQSILYYYRDTAEAGEKLGDFIDRIGIDTFREDVLNLANLELKL
ncbi:MAG: NAD(P)/FAD-dependent oxidoreductase [Clostridiales bacterium]|uniref:NAD(P)/FAD-dependent oxidoreductase n=1 Tax=Terrisporobacter sp. TaxID=1965305 RepID=UPI002A45B1BF|nr:NAD(P)/FAD-dependent oxidoreductase [Terrisporobacter sp.]MCI5628128.1 NAD(P)/FAD-dependent oxidoreductase [Clostridium sp.]MDD5878211.1 NAD(P)/FAD-dependent oxidoreductase [Clostridiales bacterium]MCI6456804.1 NAD(P)/FAD-dependent oxidoreductase [Clostridium sp.]MCI7205822.1 NAD(P)/FAD-dependent oxidoreductase [Clostridium sp.]MDD7754793.1 NAD(P)/FAD-dependent oxidoreductase [Clostridiales bacterium]